jgi:hypothetical protein
MDIHALDKALENEGNASIMQTTHSEIKKKKNDILQKLQLKGTVLKTMHATLIGYKYIEDISDLQVGRYIRWISLKYPDRISLTNGAYVCNINIDYVPVSKPDEYEYDDDNDDDADAYEDEEDEEEELTCKSCLRCKVVRNGRVSFFNLNFDENLIFQKITEQEWIILDALEYLKS